MFGVLLASFAFVNALVFFSFLFITPPHALALCGADCNAQEQELLANAWGSYRLHNAITLLCIAVIFAVIGVINKKNAAIKTLSYSVVFWLVTIVLATMTTGRDIYVQFANPALSSGQVGWIAFEWLVAASTLLAGIFFLERKRIDSRS